MNIYYADADKAKHSFIAKLFTNYSEHRIVYNTASGKELIEEIQKSTPELIIMDLILFEFDGFMVLEKLQNKIENIPILLYTCISDEHLIGNAFCMGVKDVICKSTSFMRLLDAVNYVSTELEKECLYDHFPENFSNDQLHFTCQLISQLGILPNLKGYQFSKDAVLMLANRRSILEGHLNDIYNILAVKYDTKSYCIERNIRNAIEIAWIKGNIQLINELFGYTVRSEKGKPTNSEFLVMIADKVRLAYPPAAKAKSKNTG